MNQVSGQTPEVSDVVPRSSYPVSVDYPRQETYNRFWAIPVLGLTVKIIILLPHLILMYFFFVVLGVIMMVLWIPVLFGGRYPQWGYSFVGGALRWHARVGAYTLGLSDHYPAFSFAPGEPGQDTDVSYEMGGPANRFWAVPILGIAVKVVILIPHLIVLYALNIVTAVLLLLAWAPVLFTGQYPDWGTSLIGGTLRWTIRVEAYLFGLTDRYPPFQLAA